jgi:DNA-directed RNA polymerase specialized sigma24 family protein
MRLPTDLILGGSMTNDLLAANGPQEKPAVFDARFSRCFRLLHFIASRILGGPEQSHDAIERCWLTASRNPPRFKYEGAFRSWLVRVLIDEALAILRDETKSGEKNVRLPVPTKENSNLRTTVWNKRVAWVSSPMQAEMPQGSSIESHTSIHQRIRMRDDERS